MLKTGLLGYPIEHSLSPAIHNAAYAALGLDWEYALYPCEDVATFLQTIANASEDVAHVVGFNVTTPYKVEAYAACAEHSPFAAATANANVLTFLGEGRGWDREMIIPLLRRGSSVSENSPVDCFQRERADRPLGKAPAGGGVVQTLRGDNTDGYGLLVSLEREGGVSVAGSSVVLCGTGPVAMSALLALIEARVASVSVIARDLGKGREQLRRLCERLEHLGYLGHQGDLTCLDSSHPAPFTSEHRPEFASLSTTRLVSYDEVATCLETADILIDATSVGMSPSDEAVVPLKALRPDMIVLDVVYGHGETALLKGARVVGAKAIDGLGMLIEQAALTIELWAHARGMQVEAPRELMRQAVTGS